MENIYYTKKKCRSIFSLHKFLNNFGSLYYNVIFMYKETPIVFNLTFKIYFLFAIIISKEARVKKCMTNMLFIMHLMLSVIQ